MEGSRKKTYRTEGMGEHRSMIIMRINGRLVQYHLFLLIYADIQIHLLHVSISYVRGTL